MSLIKGVLAGKEVYGQYKTAINIASGAYFGQLFFQKIIKEAQPYLACRTCAANFFAGSAEHETKKRGDLHIEEITKKLSDDVCQILFDRKNWECIASELKTHIDTLSEKELNDELYKESYISYYQVYVTTTLNKYYQQATATVEAYLNKALSHFQYLKDWISTCTVVNVSQISENAEAATNSWTGTIGTYLVCAKQHGTRIIFAIIKENTKQILLPYVLDITNAAIESHVSNEEMQTLLKDCASVVVKDIYLEQLSELKNSLYTVLLSNLQNKIRKELPPIIKPIVQNMVVLSSKSVGKAVKISTEKSIDFASEKFFGTLSSVTCYSAALPVIQYLGSIDVSAAQLMMIPAGGYISIVTGEKVYSYFYPSAREIQKKEFAESLQAPAKQALAIFLQTTFSFFGYQIEVPDLILNELTAVLLSSGTDMLINHLTPNQS